MNSLTPRMLISLVIALVLTSCINIKNTPSAETVPKSKQKEAASSKQQKKDTEKGKEPFKPYEEIITDEAKTDKGLFSVHKVDEKYYYEIPNSLLGVEMLLVSRKAKTPDNMGYGGERVNSQVLRWQRKGNKILLRHVSYENVANDSLPVYKAVRRSNFEPVIASFDIKALSKDSDGAVIEVTDLYQSDIPSLTIPSRVRKRYQIRRLDDDRTFVDYIHSYPKNIEVENLLTYTARKPPSNAGTGTVSLKMHHSMVLLPQNKMRARDFDRRVGYFSVQQTDYGTQAQKAKQARFITRYELVPKDKEAYLNGELVEPVEPIVYYIDRATPKRWREYFIKGVEAWNKAFRAAGFKNAIVAKIAPTAAEDSTYSPEDIRYSVIRYFASPVQNAYGPHVHDPRTGQILESDIGWYHNVMSLLRNWYFVQTAAANPKARDVKYSTQLMGKLMQFVVTHEVGHTLGLQHSFSSSYAYPVDSLRSPSFTSTHGTAPSIMDYARFNYIAQPGDGVTQFFPQIGEYDKWAIKWGYTWFPESMTGEEVEAELDRWIAEKAGNPLYFFNNNFADPRSQTEDLGNNAMKAGRYGISNLKVVTDHLVEWTKQQGENLDVLEERYKTIVNQYELYIGHVISYIGGIFENPKNFGQEGVVYKPMAESKQRAAMEFLDTYAFQTQKWLLDEDILSLINQYSVVDEIKSMQYSILRQILAPYRLKFLLDYQARYQQDTYTASEMMSTLQDMVWAELDSHESISMYRRNLQRSYLQAMKSLLRKEVSDIRSLARAHLTQLLKEVKQYDSSDRATQNHLETVAVQIETMLDPANR